MRAQFDINNTCEPDARHRIDTTYLCLSSNSFMKTSSINEAHARGGLNGHWKEKRVRYVSTSFMDRIRIFFFAGPVNFNGASYANEEERSVIMFQHRLLQFAVYFSLFKYYTENTLW